ncbi:hypothetical protein HGM15179_010448 [Zosterops borbonicus]|uniref:Transcription factor JunB n=1 Tax=Zosterops borbonicus TaxID=364589 RepID=A0A8K1GFB7_9PASS|nr:hypothetical protein HGM15179_010448 [Zosterops borbonicus]
MGNTRTAAASMAGAGADTTSAAAPPTLPAGHRAPAPADRPAAQVSLPAAAPRRRGDNPGTGAARPCPARGVILPSSGGDGAPRTRPRAPRFAGGRRARPRLPGAAVGHCCAAGVTWSRGGSPPARPGVTWSRRRSSPPRPSPAAAAAADPPAVYTNLSGFNPAGPLSPSGSAYPSASAPPPPPGLAFGAAGLGSARLPPTRPLEEPQTVPEVPPSAGGEGGSSAPTPPSLSPLDAESQERLKAERKRLRNRIAASKCRRRKLERIARLEEKVKALKGQNAELAATANLLRAQVTQLQGRVRSHLSSGCHINAAGHPPPPPHAAAQPRETPPEGPAAPESSAC